VADEREQVTFITKIDEEGNLHTSEIDVHGIIHPITREDIPSLATGSMINAIESGVTEAMKQIGVSKTTQIIHTLKFQGVSSLFTFATYYKDAEK
jgi:hypothetical protein